MYQQTQKPNTLTGSVICTMNIQKLTLLIGLVVHSAFLGQSGIELFSHWKNQPRGSLDHTQSLNHSVTQSFIYLVEFSMFLSVYKVTFWGAREIAQVDPHSPSLWTLGLDFFFLHIESNQPNPLLAPERLLQEGKWAFPSLHKFSWGFPLQASDSQELSLELWEKLPPSDLWWQLLLNLTLFPPHRTMLPWGYKTLSILIQGDNNKMPGCKYKHNHSVPITIIRSTGNTPRYQTPKASAGICLYIILGWPMGLFELHWSRKLVTPAIWLVSLTDTIDRFIC